MKDDMVYLEHIIDCIDRIEEYTESDQFTFMNSSMVQDAVTRNLQILSESTQKISDPLKQQYPDINWRAISGFRNVLVHDYLGLDNQQIWQVIENRLPNLKEQIESIISSKK